MFSLLDLSFLDYQSTSTCRCCGPCTYVVFFSHSLKVHVKVNSAIVSTQVSDILIRSVAAYNFPVKYFKYVIRMHKALELLEKALVELSKVSQRLKQATDFHL